MRQRMGSFSRLSARMETFKAGVRSSFRLPEDEQSMSKIPVSKTLEATMLLACIASSKSLISSQSK